MDDTDGPTSAAGVGIRSSVVAGLVDQVQQIVKAFSNSLRSQGWFHPVMVMLGDEAGSPLPRPLARQDNPPIAASSFSVRPSVQSDCTLCHLGL